MEDDPPRGSRVFESGLLAHWATGENLITSYIIRHARTGLNPKGVLSGDPTAPVTLDDVGREQSIMCSKLTWALTAACVVTSTLPRARETADLAFTSLGMERHEDPRLNEIDYGEFEGRRWSEYGEWLRRQGPDARPVGSTESWSEAMGRVLDGIEAAAVLPAPRVIIGHGFWVSALHWVHKGDGWTHVADIGSVGHLEPLTFDDSDLRRAIDRCRTVVRQPPRWSFPPGRVT